MNASVKTGSIEDELTSKLSDKSSDMKSKPIRVAGSKEEEKESTD
jgi:hypothetical protein